MNRLEEIAEPFQMADRDFRLELLLEYSDKLPELPDDYRELRDQGMNMVHECQSPVFLMAEVEDGTVRVIGDVPREAPTARAFVSILRDAFDGEPPSEVLDAPADALRVLGLSDLLGMQRTQGLSAIYGRLRKQVREKSQSQA
ncbi:Fe-S metabolism protein SufE [Longibacter salinarum]|uniref:Fe-S metabolism protein SufE n=1 Tax=Longibacter salinarum TaxID=1850348 RepID=A0A2A8D176_9BACT|nr:SufE family protein [Longibacter salinarum]PEN14685.1 Fe-S metabolism protein SufE [Longibacter salinarum]